jgi:hypothetical protein
MSEPFVMLPDLSGMTTLEFLYGQRIQIKEKLATFHARWRDACMAWRAIQQDGERVMSREMKRAWDQRVWLSEWERREIHSWLNTFEWDLEKCQREIERREARQAELLNQ